MQSGEEIVFLNRADVVTALGEVDALACVERALLEHAAGRTTLPAEGYLSWTNSAGAYSRSIAMLGALTGDQPAYGMKLINASVSNPARGLARAGGLSFLFDPETARPVLIAEAALLSATRTAAYTMISLRHLGPVSWDAVSLIGCGAQARAHVELIAKVFPGVGHVHVFDLDPARAAELAAWVPSVGLAATVEPTVEAAVGAAPVTITLTTSDTPYLPATWIRPGSFIAHVSLDDLTADVFTGAQAIYVDDIGLIAENPRRIMGRLIADGVISDGTSPGRRIDATLSEILLGQRVAVRPSDGYVVSNPFGMSILDISLIAAVHEAATRRGIGQRLTVS